MSCDALTAYRELNAAVEKIGLVDCYCIQRHDRKWALFAEELLLDFFYMSDTRHYRIRPAQSSALLS